MNNYTDMSLYELILEYGDIMMQIGQALENAIKSNSEIIYLYGVKEEILSLIKVHIHGDQKGSL